MPGFALKTVIIVIAIALLVIVVSRAFRRAPAKGTSSRRMPLPGVLGAAVLLAVGFLLALVSFTSQYTADLLPMRIAAVVAVLAGAVVLFISSRRARRR